MRMSILQAVVASVVLAAGCGTPAAPSALTATARTGATPSSAASESATNRQPERSVPFKGRLEGTVTLTPLEPPLANVLIVADGNATHLGGFHLEVPHLVSFATATGEGTYTFTAANGDMLTARFTGVADTSTAIFTIVEHATITGGTGRFANASGSFDVHRAYDTAAGTTTGSFDGTISF